MQAYQENISAKVSGVLSPVLGVQVTVTDTTTGNPAALYSDNGVTPIAQPLVTDETGYFGFYAANGRYMLSFVSAQVKLAPRIVQLYDPADDSPLTQAQAAASSGASKIGVGTETVENALNALQLADFTALRAYPGPRKSAYVTGYLGTAAPTGVAGMFVRDDSDTTSSDNGGTIIVSANGVRWKRQMSGFVLIDWFGAVGNGIADDTVACKAALAFALANALQLHGGVGRNYKVSQKLSVTAGTFVFDGHNCLFTNAIINATAADPLFELANTSISGVWMGNFRVNGTGVGNNGHVVALLGALSTGPQFVTLSRIWVQSNSGNGKDYTGAAIASKLLYAYGGMAIKIDKCVSYQSGGLHFDNTLKITVSGTTIDSPPAGRLLYLNACNGVVVSEGCIFNGGTTDQVEVNACRGVLVLGNRLKGGTARQFYAHGQSSNVVFRSNQQEVYSLTTNAVEFTTAVAGMRALENSLAFINGGGSSVTFTASGIALVDEPGGGYISAAAEISGNGFIVNSLMTITNLISATSSSNSVRALKVNGNALAAPGGGSGSTVTNGINLGANVIGAEVGNNQYGATAGNTMTNGMVIGASCSGTRLIENYNLGNCTNAVSDSNGSTTRREGGAQVPNTFTPAISGTTTAGAGTYSSQVGTYTLDGKIANVGINLAWSAHTGTGSAMTINLPFTCANRVQVLSVLADSLTYTGQLVAAVSAGDNRIRLWAETSGGALAQIALDTAATLYISGTLELA